MFQQSLLGKLFNAITENDMAAVEDVMNCGVDINETCRGRDMLNLAAAYGHTEIAAKLLDAGADVNKTSRNGMTPLMEALQWGHAETSFLLLEAGADVNVASTSNTTPLMHAVVGNDMKMVRELLDRGGDTSVRNCEGHTARDIAVKNNRDEAMVSLLYHGVAFQKQKILKRLSVRPVIRGLRP